MSTDKITTFFQFIVRKSPSRWWIWSPQRGTESACSWVVLGKVARGLRGQRPSWRLTVLVRRCYLFLKSDNTAKVRIAPSKPVVVGFIDRKCSLRVAEQHFCQLAVFATRTISALVTHMEPQQSNANRMKRSVDCSLFIKQGKKISLRHLGSIIKFSVWCRERKGALEIVFDLFSSDLNHFPISCIWESSQGLIGVFTLCFHMLNTVIVNIGLKSKNISLLLECISLHFYIIIIAYGLFLCMLLWEATRPKLIRPETRKFIQSSNKHLTVTKGRKPPFVGLKTGSLEQKKLVFLTTLQRPDEIEFSSTIPPPLMGH